MTACNTTFLKSEQQQQKFCPSDIPQSTQSSIYKNINSTRWAQHTAGNHDVSHQKKCLGRIQAYLKRLETLKSERSTWLAGWREIASACYPWMNRRLSNPADRSGRHGMNRLVHSAPSWAVNVLAAGLTSGMTPQSRKWFRLRLPKDGADIVDESAVNAWLYEVEDAIFATLQRSNAYDVLPSLFLSLALFGTAVLFVDADETDEARFYQPQNATFVLAQSGRQVVNVFMRELTMTVDELIDRFGLNSVSRRVREMAQRGENDTLVEVVHVIEPSEHFNPNALESKDAAPFVSVFFERGIANRNTHESAKFLEEKGFFELPVMAARWEVADGDVYGIGPGHKALGDCLDLKRNMITQARLLDQLTAPPLAAPSTIKLHGGVRLLPGAVTYFDPTLGPPNIAPLIAPNPNGISALIAQEEAIKERIRQAFFVDIFLSLSQMPLKSGVTATEIMERYQEKLLMLGPVLERVNSDLLDPMIQRVFGLLYRAGRIPEPPPELIDVEIKIEYVSAVALGQQAGTVTAIEGFAAFLQRISQTFPEAAQYMDVEKTLNTYASLCDVPPSVLKSPRMQNII